ncbi:hypothetical protein GCM10010472_11050 [Pseudonocardia halophobica]|uniref:DUF2637 domain-containing protein n=1 Tax=Pseudonocardia halophobica TaxID=29401 RepID=A0A9W6L5L0_9PSEU|nr:DUF2637 domain-containing protein [Pseudonocardia halophobica]GLL13492.1 hypothetical protein GCM10017577_46360 [Pseudonocardia halophobica]
MKRAPWIVWAGLAVVLSAAAILSFDALRGLAIAVSIPSGFAWLLPIVVDAGAAVACTIWLSPSSPRDASRFAAWMTWSLLVATVAGNAGQLGLHAHGITPPWWVAVAVGAIAPAVVGSVVHLVVLLVRETGPVPDRVPLPEVDDAPAEVESEAWRDPWSRWAGPDVDTPPVLEAVPALDQQGPPVPASADPLLPEVLRWAQERGLDRVSQRAVRAEFGVGGPRSARLLSQLQEVAQ